MSNYLVMNKECALFIFVFSLFFLLPISSFTQVYPYLFETKAKLLKKGNNQRLGRYDDWREECRYEVLGDSQMIYLYKKYYCQSENIDFQYVRVGQDSFFYTKFENDSLNLRIEEGIYLFGIHHLGFSGYLIIISNW